MLELNKGNPILLLISILLLLIWFIYRWIYKKHKKWILAYYLWQMDRIGKHCKIINNLLERYPNELTLMLTNIAMYILIKKQNFINNRAMEIMNSDLSWRMRK